MTALHYRTLTEVARDIAAGKLSSGGLTRALLSRIQSLNPRLKAYYSVLAEDAMAQASERDAARAQGEIRGPLHGVPVAVKDLCHKRGSVTTGGLSFRRGAVSSEDATVVARLEAAGAVVLGKLATTEGAMTGYHRDFDVPRNPWGLDRWPGVSSGGSGVATAAGLCFGAVGTDTGGSIRWPSSMNGVVGLKPTWGRVSRHNVMDLAPTLDHVGPMTRSVRDAARMLGVMAGHDPFDSTSIAAPVPDYEGMLATGVEGLRIGWDEAYATEGVDSHVANAVRTAVSQLADSGAEVVPITIPQLTAEEADIWMTLTTAEAAVVHADTYPENATDYGEFFGQFLAMGHAVSGTELARANILRRQAVGRVAPVFANVDVLVMPTTASEAFRYDPNEAYTGISSDKARFAGFPLSWRILNGRFVALWDLNGYPTLSQPCGFSPDGMPLSLQWVAAPLGEASLFRAGHAFEQANDFAHRHPID